MLWCHFRGWGEGRQMGYVAGRGFCDFYVLVAVPVRTRNGPAALAAELSAEGLGLRDNLLAGAAGEELFAGGFGFVWVCFGEGFGELEGGEGGFFEDGLVGECCFGDGEGGG